MAGRPTAKIVLQQVKPILSVDRCEAKGGVLKRYEAPCSLPDFNTLNENTNQIILNGQVLNIKTSYKNQCKYCPKSFRKSSDLKRHIRTHTGERPFKCNICEKGFSLKKTLNIHQNVHQMIIKHQCSVCGIYDSTKSSLTEHMRLHTDSPLALDTNPYVCPFCPLDFQTIDQRTSHLHVHDKEVSETGILPNDVTTRKAKMAVFMKHFNNILKMQDIKKENKENSTHSENSQVKTIEKAVDSNNGEFIQFENSQKQTFESIVDSNNGEFIQFENSQPKTSESIVDSDNVEFIHFVLETNENGEVLSLKPVSDMLLVDQIDQSAKFDETTKECIPNFLREKTDKEMFECQTCSKKFRTKNALTRHQRTHTAQYNCEQCNKKFVLKSSLSRHLEKHFNNRPFACKLCPSFYTRIGNLKIHLRKDHNITDTQKPLPVPDYNSDETYIDVVN